MFSLLAKRYQFKSNMGGEVFTVLINEVVNDKINSLGRYIAVFHLCQTTNVKQWCIYIWSKDKFWIHVVQKSSCAVPGRQQKMSEAEFS